jgi:hypothetical protein
MIRVLVDHNMEGHAILLWGVLAAEGWLDLVPLRLMTFSAVGLPFDSDDRTVWCLVQAQRMLLLTDNRSMKGPDSLEQTMMGGIDDGGLVTRHIDLSAPEGSYQLRLFDDRPKE